MKTQFLNHLTAHQFTLLCQKYNACNKGLDFIKGKTPIEFINTCHRGDWMLWLFKKTAPCNLQMLTLAKGHCANTVRHLMKDGRSIKAVDTAIAFGEGKATREDLNAAYAAAAAAYAAAAAAYTAAAAAYAAAAAAADAAAADTYAAAAYAAAADARSKNRLLTANLCRKYLKFSNIEIELL